ncbi:MAG: alpha/beta hydrolase-fold protein [Acidobacteriota bacterium]|nr:alpha/beta hydrolase-fold protein [Acidobacteriota bacterium]
MKRIRTTLSLVAAIALSACATQQRDIHTLAAQAQLQSRPVTTAKPALRAGYQKLNLSGTKRDGVLYVPRNIANPAPLILMLHGNRDSGEIIIRHVREIADEIGAIVVAPDSRGYTWDLAQGPVDETAINRFGADIAFIDRTLEYVFARYPIDPKRVAIGGFSDGGSYALSVGLMNGNLFTHVVAFSPGFMRLKRTAGHPNVFIAHGTSDDILPIDKCGRMLARAIGDAGYKLKYVEFQGRHIVVDQIARQAFAHWFAQAG